MPTSRSPYTFTLFTALFFFAVAWFANAASKRSHPRHPSHPSPTNDDSTTKDPFEGAMGYINEGTPSCPTSGTMRCLYLYNANFLNFVSFTGNVTCLGGLAPVTDNVFHVACQADPGMDVQMKFECTNSTISITVTYPSADTGNMPTLETSDNATALFSTSEPDLSALQTGSQTADSIDENAYFSCAGNGN